MYISEYSDYRTLTDKERRKISNLLYFAIVDIRNLSLEGESEHAADLADTFHTLPTDLWSDRFSLKLFRDFLVAYEEKYPKRKGFKYLKVFDEMVKTNFEIELII